MFNSRKLTSVHIRVDGRNSLLAKAESIGSVLSRSVVFTRSRLIAEKLDKILRMVRAVVGGIIILTITSAMLIPQLLPVSGNSIVNAKLEWIRTPIEGDLNFAGYKVGDSVFKGQIVGSINNKRADDSFLNQLRAEQTTLESVMFSLDQKYLQLGQRKQDLTARVSMLLEGFREQTRIRVSRMQTELAFSYEEISEVDSRIERYEKANRDYSTTEDYSIVSRATLEDLYVRQTELNAVISSRINTLEILEAEFQAAANGSYSGDATPPEQLQLIDIEQALLAVSAERNSLTMKSDNLKIKVDERLEFLNRNRNHNLRARVTGKLWDVGYADGSYVHNGDSIFAIADTESLSVEANFHQRYLDNIKVGDHATIDLMGSSEKLTGKVREVRIRDQVKSTDLSAFSVLRPQLNEFKVLVTLDKDQKHVPHIGQRAKVIISETASSVAPRLLLFFNR